MIMCVSLFIVLLVAHVIGDFYLQNDNICDSKQKGRFCSKWTYLHPLIVAAISWFVIFDIAFWPFALVLLMSHFVFDSVKSYSKDSIVAFIVDQLAHLAVLISIAYLWQKNSNWTTPDFMYIKDLFLPEYILAVLILIKPSNIFIKKVLAAYQLHEKNSNKIGSLIGTLERLLTFLLIMAGQFSAVGFLVTAKSILRFKDTQTEKTEYVLAGTLLSFGLAIVVGMLTYYRMLWWFEL